MRTNTQTRTISQAQLFKAAHKFARNGVMKQDAEHTMTYNDYFNYALTSGYSKYRIVKSVRSVRSVKSVKSVRSSDKVVDFKWLCSVVRGDESMFTEFFEYSDTHVVMRRSITFGRDEVVTKERARSYISLCKGYGWTLEKERAPAATSESVTKSVTKSVVESVVEPVVEPVVPVTPKVIKPVRKEISHEELSNML